MDVEDDLGKGPMIGFSAGEWRDFLPRQSDFIESLHHFFPTGSFLWMEGLSPQSEEFCRTRSNGLKLPAIRRETIEPVQRVGYLPITPDNLKELAALIRSGDPERAFAYHVKIHHRGKILLYWADYPDPMHSFITGEMPRDRAVEFCKWNDFESSED